MVDDFLRRAESRQARALASLDQARRAERGQFFTPRRAASLIASMPRLPQSGRLRVLDPGAGVGMLAAALVQRVLTEAPELQLEIISVELDATLADFLHETMADCQSTAAANGCGVATRVVIGDFIERSAGVLGAESVLDRPVDLVIMNPPYAKLGSGARARTAMRNFGVDCSNLYTAFMTLGIDALASGGQLVSITPRSFTNGPYFERFRKHLLRNIAIDRLHTFESRNTVFADSGVLQENLVLAGTRDGDRNKILLTASKGHEDQASSYLMQYEQMVQPGDPRQFIRIATSDGDATQTASLLDSAKATIRDLGVVASTGRVVDFRSRANLRPEASNGHVPLVYPGNLSNGLVEWPRAIGKAQGFAVCQDVDRKLLLPPGRYVVVKRFSAKEERRRIVAAVWDPTYNGSREVAFENHLNVFHRAGAGLDRDLAIGLSIWLNSTMVDKYFRTFSGHTQVNATDLRALPYPHLATLRAIGLGRSGVLPRQDEIDRIITDFLERHEKAA